MAGLTCRKKGAKNKHIKKANLKTKRYRRDIDQVVLGDLQPANAEKLENQEIDEEQAGLAQFYCLHCCRYFICDDAMRRHFKTKEHKKRMKTCREIPYSHEEAERAGGLMPARERFTNAIYSGKKEITDLPEFAHLKTGPTQELQGKKGDETKME